MCVETVTATMHLHEVTSQSEEHSKLWPKVHLQSIEL